MLLQIVCGDEYNIRNNIYIWNFINLDCILHLKLVYKEGFVYSASLFQEKNELYLILSNNNGKEFSQPLKVFDIKGNKVNEIKSLKRNINIYMCILMKN